MMPPMPRVPPFDRPATYDDLVKLPDNLVAEIVDGELHASPRPAPPHTEAGAIIGGRLVPPFHEGRGGPGGWRILYENGRWTIIAAHARSEVVRAEPFSEIELDLQALWAD
jgi:hypothetical protein